GVAELHGVDLGASVGGHRTSVPSSPLGVVILVESLSWSFASLVEISRHRPAGAAGASGRRASARRSRPAAYAGPRASPPERVRTKEIRVPHPPFPVPLARDRRSDLVDPPDRRARPARDARPRDRGDDRRWHPRV